MMTTQPLCPKLSGIRRFALSLSALCAVALPLPALADVALTIDGDKVGGELTLDQNSDTVTLVDEDGKSKTIKLIDLDQVRFGENLVKIEDGNKLLINNDRLGSAARKSAKVKLRAGLHRFVIPYWQATGEFAMEVNVTGPGIGGVVTLGSNHMRCFRSTSDKTDPSPGVDEEGFRLPELALDEANNRRRMLSRCRYRLYAGEKEMRFEDVSVLSRMPFKRSGTSSSLNTSIVNDQKAYFGLVFEGFFKADQDGEYNFTLTSDDGSQLYLGTVEQFRVQSLNGVSLPTRWHAELANNGLARGEFKGIADDKLVLHLPLISDVELSLSHVRALWDSKADAAAIDRKDEPADQDTAYIRDKTKTDLIRSVSGQVVAMDEESLTFNFKGEPRTISADRVVGLVFAHKSRPIPANPGFHQILEIKGGQRLPCKVDSIGERVNFDILGGSRCVPPRDVLVSMRSQNGRRVDLTLVQPTAQEAIPYFGLAIPLRVNETFSGKPIRLFDGKVYKRGLAVHSKSRLHFKLDRPCESFRASFGLMDPGGKLGNVTARVIGDGKVLWEKPGIDAQALVIPVEIDLKGVERLILEVDFGEGQNVGDRAAWCDPQLIFASPQ